MMVVAASLPVILVPAFRSASAAAFWSADIFFQRHSLARVFARFPCLAAG